MAVSGAIEFELILTVEYERFQVAPGNWKTTMDKEPHESKKIITTIRREAKLKNHEIVEEIKKESTGHYKDKIIDLDETVSPKWDHKKKAPRKWEFVNHLDGPPDVQIIETLKILFGPGGVIIAFITALTPILSKWLNNRATRSIKIKKGDVEIEIKGKNDIPKALKSIQDLINNSSGQEQNISQPDA